MRVSQMTAEKKSQPEINKAINSPARSNGLHPGGRPTKYRDDFPALLLAYFDEQVAAEKLPFLSKFARNIAGVCEDTAIEWTKDHPEFSEAYKIAKKIQKEFLITQALAGKINPTAFIFTAKNMTDMRDKTEVAHDMPGIQDILERIHKGEK